MITFRPLSDSSEGGCNSCGGSEPIGQLEIGKQHRMVSRLCYYCLLKMCDVVEFQINSRRAFKKRGNVKPYPESGWVQESPSKMRASLKPLITKKVAGKKMSKTLASILSE